MDVGEDCHTGEVAFSLQHSEGHMTSTRLVTGDANLHCLVKVMSARSLCGEVTVFPLSIL